MYGYVHSTTLHFDTTVHRKYSLRTDFGFGWLIVHTKKAEKQIVFQEIVERTFDNKNNAN